METTITLLGPDLKPVQTTVKFDWPISMVKEINSQIQKTNHKGELTVQTKFAHDRIVFYVDSRRYEPDNKHMTIVLGFYPKTEIVEQTTISFPTPKKKSFWRR